MAGIRPTIGDVARAAGVSKGTVSLAYSGKRPVSAATRSRIFAAAAALGWTASARARALATSRSSTIGLALARTPDVLANDSFFPPFIAGCETVLSSAGMGLMLNIVTSETEEESTYRRYAAGLADGVILLDLRVGDRRPALMRELELPAVMLTARKPTEEERHGLSAVYVEDAPAVRDIVARMVEAGHRRIAHVSGPTEYVHASERREAFVSALAFHGLDASLIAEGDFSAASGRDCTARLLEGQDRPTAIVYANDTMAIAGLSLALDRGLRVPQDLSLTGFDDMELAAHLSPALTTVATDAHASGVRATERLLGDLHGEDPATEHRDTARVRSRGTIGPVPTSCLAPLAPPSPSSG